MGSVWQSFMEFLTNTNIPEQVSEVDWRGLFTNPWFILPMLTQLGWWVYKQEINAIIITCLGFGVWIFSGTTYASGMVVNGILQLDKVLPVAGVGMGALMIIIYLYFLRGD